jgi:hypothetical protein
MEERTASSSNMICDHSWFSPLQTCRLAVSERRLRQKMNNWERKMRSNWLRSDRKHVRTGGDNKMDELTGESFRMVVAPSASDAHRTDDRKLWCGCMIGRLRAELQIRSARFEGIAE